MRAALAALRADAAAAGKLAFAADAAAEFKSFAAAADKADKALAKNDGKAAGKALAEAAQALAAARQVQSGHGQYATMLAAVEAKLKALQALPTARVDQVELRADRQGACRREGQGQGEARGRGARRAAPRQRRRGRGRAGAARPLRVRRSGDRPERRRSTRWPTPRRRRSYTQALDEARKIADKLRFGDAKAALKAIEVKIDEAS
jgi:phosphopantetheinyl transferase (holo-ACP synthase)